MTTFENGQVGEIEQVFQALAGTDRQVVNVLNTIQEHYGYLPEQSLYDVSRQFGIPLANIYGLVSFFSGLRTRPVGRNQIAVCCGTACYARGSEKVFTRLKETMQLDADGTSEDGFVTISKVPCVGACSLAPVLSVNGVLEGKIKPLQVTARLEELQRNDSPSD